MRPAADGYRRQHTSSPARSPFDMFVTRFYSLGLPLLIGLAAVNPLLAEEALNSSGPPDPEQNPGSPLMLAGDWLPEDPHRIDFDRLPAVPSQHATISDARPRGGVNQHNYLVHHEGRYFAMWSDGPGIEDQVGQRVKYATSRDGLQWSEPQFLTPIPPRSGPDSPHYGKRTSKGFRYIARGFWQREQQLYALAALDEAAGFFGSRLALHAFRWQAGEKQWLPLGPIADNAINNFPPQRLATGQWMMSRRTFDYRRRGVQFLVGGTDSLKAWESFPVLGSSSELKAEEPVWYRLPDDALVALFRDNRGSKFLYRSFSTDAGRTWSKPTRTNFPDATSKLYAKRLRDGLYVLISNSNPKARDPLTVALSRDGMTYDRLAVLIGGRQVDYPHAIEHDGHLLVAFSGAKQRIEVLKIPTKALQQIKMPGDVRR